MVSRSKDFERLGISLAKHQGAKVIRHNTPGKPYKASMKKSLNTSWVTSNDKSASLKKIPLRLRSSSPSIQPLSTILLKQNLSKQLDHTRLACKRYSEHSLGLKIHLEQGDEVTSETLEIYSNLFSEIIHSSREYGRLLLSVKNVYEQYIQSIKTGESNEILRLKVKLESEKQEKRILLEKGGANGSIGDLQTELQKYKKREKTYQKLLRVMKQQGYPVEEIYNSYIRGTPKQMDGRIPRLKFPSEDEIF